MARQARREEGGSTGQADYSTAKKCAMEEWRATRSQFLSVQSHELPFNLPRLWCGKFGLCREFAPSLDGGTDFVDYPWRSADAEAPDSLGLYGECAKRCYAE
jgi:hypothetical protein